MVECDSQEAFEQQIPIQEAVTYLNTHLDPFVTGIMAVRVEYEYRQILDKEAVKQLALAWERGKEVPNDEATRSLRAAAEVLDIFKEHDALDHAQAWFRRRNPLTGNVPPAFGISMTPKNVLAAARDHFGTIRKTI